MPQRLNFANEFNNRLGQFTGNLAEQTSLSVLNTNVDARRENDLHRLALAKALDRRAKLENKNSNDPNYDPVLGNLNKPAIDRITESDGLSFDDIKGGAMWLPKKWLQANLDVGSKLLDYASRPAYGAFEGLKERAETLGQGESEVQALDNILGGVWSGLSGKEKTGWGAVVEANAQRDPTSAIDKISFGTNLGRWNPLLNTINMGLGQNKTLPGDTNKWGKRAQGALGEITFDPLNFVGAGVAGKVADGVKGAADFTKARYIDEAAKVTNEALESRGLGNTFRKLKLTPTGLGADGKKVASNRPVGWDNLYKIIEDTIDASIIQTGGGATQGRVVGNIVAPHALATSVSEGVRAQIFSEFDDAVTKFISHLDGTAPMTEAQIKALRSKVPYFNNFMDELVTQINKGRKVNKFNSLDEALLYYSKVADGPGNIIRRSRNAVSVVKSGLDDTIRAIQDDVYQGLAGKVYNAPGIKVFGKQVGSFDRIGKAYETFKRTRLPEKGLSGLSFAQQFPGRTSLMNQRIRSLGVIPYEKLHAQVRDIASGLTPSQRKEITTAILNDTTLLDPKMEEARQFIKGEYAKMFSEEVDAGVRSATDELASNYVYSYYRKGSKHKIIDNYRKLTKDTVRKTKSLPRNFVDEAKRLGLKPEEDAFRALLYRKLKSNRDLSRSWFISDLIDHYGLLSNRLSSRAAIERGLKKVTSNIPNDIKATMKAGDEWYLPANIYEVYQNFLKLSSNGYNEDTAALLRSYDRVTRLFKVSATIPYPGFHIRNALGDMFMSHFDGVRSGDYTWTWKLKQAHAHPEKTAEVFIGGDKFTYDELLNIFQRNASSGGFHSTELNADSIFTRVNPNRVTSKAKELSEGREDFFRLTHFLKAFKEEYPKAIREAGSKERAMQKAIDAATYRVNKYLLDYGALTSFERNVIKRAMPFYTYSRKTLPTLLESLFLRPDQISKTNRLFLDREDGTYQDMFIPEYQREIGYARLSEDDTENPWILGGQFLPTDMMKKNTDFSSPGGFFRNILSQTNPIPKSVIELAAGEKFFNDQKISSTSQYATDSFLPFAGPINDAVGGVDALAALPGISEGNKEGVERVLAGRFGFGLPFDKITEDQRTAAIYGLQDKLFNELDKANKELESKGYRLYLSKRTDGATYRIRNERTGKIIFESKDPEEAIRQSLQL